MRRYATAGVGLLLSSVLAACGARSSSPLMPSTSTSEYQSQSLSLKAISASATQATSKPQPGCQATICVNRGSTVQGPAITEPYIPSPTPNHNNPTTKISFSNNAANGLTIKFAPNPTPFTAPQGLLQATTIPNITASINAPLGQQLVFINARTSDGSFTQPLSPLSIQVCTADGDCRPKPTLVYKQALAWKHHSDSAFGTPCANDSAAVVNHIIHTATGEWVVPSDTVNPNSFYNDGVRSANLSPIASQANTIAGDIIFVESADSYYADIGICLNKGCTEMIANDGGPCTFSLMTEDFAYKNSPYKNAPYLLYLRVN